MSTDVPLPEPVAWLQVGQPDSLNAGDVIARTYLPKRYDEKWWRFDPLYTADQLRTAIEAAVAEVNAHNGALTDKCNSYIIANARLAEQVAEARAVPADLADQIEHRLLTLAGVLRLVVGDAEMFCRAAHHSKADRHEAFEPCPIHARAVAALQEQKS